jgi:hypothetical protein
MSVIDKQGQQQLDLLFKAGKLQRIEVIAETEYHQENPSFYEAVQKWPEEHSNMTIDSLQIIDTENRRRKAIILYRKRV